MFLLWKEHKTECSKDIFFFYVFDKVRNCGFIFDFHPLVYFINPEGWALICCHTELFYMTSHNLIPSLWGILETSGQLCRWDEDIPASAEWDC